MSPLTQLVVLRREKADLEARIKAVEQAATDEAMEIAAVEGKQTFRHQDTKVQIRFTSCKPKVNEHPRLAELSEQIESGREKAREEHKEQIEAWAAWIKTYQESINHCLNPEDLKPLVDEMSQLTEELTTKLPQIVIITL
jgi:hypothetical protein